MAETCISILNRTPFAFTSEQIQEEIDGAKMAAVVVLRITSKLCLHSNLRTQRQLALQLPQRVAFYQRHVKGDSETALYLNEVVLK